jgi:hypothetical protein
MNRRKFLSFLGVGAAAAIIAPELLLPKRTFFLPPAKGWTYDFSKNYNIGLDEFENRILQPAIERIKLQIDDQNMKIQMGDIITFDNVFGEAVPRKLKQFIVTSVSA